MYESRKFDSKFVAKLYLLFKDIITFLGIDYIWMLKHCCNRNKYSKNQINRIIITNNFFLMVKNQHV